MDDNKINKELYRYIPQDLKRAKDVELPLSLQEKVSEYVEYVKRVVNTDQKLTNCVLVGCPERLIVPFVSSIAGELNVRVHFVSAALIKEEGDFGTIFLNLSDSDILVISDIQSLNYKQKQIWRQTVSIRALNLQMGNHVIPVPVRVFAYLFSVKNRQDLPDELKEECFYEVDFNALKPEDIRRNFITDILQRVGLTADEEVLKVLSGDEVSESVLKSRVIELRNRALARGVTVINSGLLNEKAGNMPELKEVDIMEGRNFEIFTGNLLRSIGFINIHITPSSRDFGTDVIAEKEDVRYAIQCKRYDSPVGVSAVQEVIASKSLHDCHVACVLTNSHFTPAAEELARKNLVILWDRNKLKSFIEKANL